MKILYLAPLPPPISGHTIVTEVLLDNLRSKYSVEVVDLSVASTEDGDFTWSRLIEVFKVLYRVWGGRRNADFIYLTISESVVGNLKDLLIYLICFQKLDKFCIHLHGGSLKKVIFDQKWVLRKLNHIAIKKMGGVLVSGLSHVNIFSTMISNDRIHIIPNFAEDYIFTNEEDIVSKFKSTKPLKIIYISKMIPEKGYLSLYKAFDLLPNEMKSLVTIDFVGRFRNALERESFEKKIESEPNVCYHEVVDDKMKRKLFSESHVFCLPTTYLEGQPISILEAYASGCVVITTCPPGILDVFSDGINGYKILKNDPKAIKGTIQEMVKNPSDLSNIAQNNWRTAMSSYRSDVFSNSVNETFISIGSQTIG